MVIFEKECGYSHEKGKVKGIKVGKATITAKVGKRKYKCKITVKKAFTTATSTNYSDGLIDDGESGGSVNKPSSTYNDIAAYNAVSKSSFVVNHHVFARIQSNYAFPVSVSGKCVYYDSTGNVIEYNSDSVFYLENGRTAYLEFPFFSNDADYTNYTMTYEVTDASWFSEGSALSQISYASNTTTEGDVMITATNKGPYNCGSLYLYVL